MKRSVIISICMLLIGNLVATLPMIGLALNDPSPSGGPVTGDWNVTDLRVYSDVQIELTGNLTVETGGELILDHVTLIMNSSTSGVERYSIVVQPGGNLSIINGSTIQCNQSTNHNYNFEILKNATEVRILDSIVKDFGPMGLTVNATNVSIVNSVISPKEDVNSTGLRLLGDSDTTIEPEVINSTITADLVGVSVINANPVFDNNVVDGAQIGVQFNSTATTISGVSFTNIADRYFVLIESEIEALDCSLNTSRLEFKDSSSWIDVLWYLSVSVEWVNGTPVPLANITVDELDGTEVFNGTANASGRAGPMVLRQARFSDSGEHPSSPHNVTVIKDEVSYMVQVLMDMTKSLIVPLDGEIPAIQIAFPVNESYFNNKTIEMEGTASDNNEVAIVEVTYDGSTWILASGTMEWNATLEVPFDGTFLLEARSKDVHGNMNETNVTIIVDTVAPTVEIKSPGDGILTNVNLLTVEGTTDGDFVMVNGILAKINEEGNWTAQVSLDSEGDINLTAVAEDMAGNSAEDSVTIKRDITPPTVVITSPSDGEVVDSYTVYPEGTASDNLELETVMASTSMVVWYPVRDTTDWSVTIRLPKGDSTIYVKATDKAGNTAIAKVTVIVKIPDTTAPIVEITAPVEGIGLTRSIVTVTGIAYDDVGINLVQVSLDNSTWVDAIGTEEWTMELTLSEGANMIYAKATDAAGNSGIDMIAITLSLPIVDNVKPQITINEPTDGNKIVRNSVLVSGTASDNAAIEQVDVRVGTGPWIRCSGTTQWIATVPLEKGENTITVRAIDTSGNIDETSIKITYKEEVKEEVGMDMAIVGVIGAVIVILLVIIIVMTFGGKKKPKKEELEEEEKEGSEEE